MNQVSISVVTPSFNQGNFIGETIQSLLLQDYANLQHIVVDGGSVDSTLEVLSCFKDPPHVLLSEPDSGQSQAINKGLSLSTGDVFNWLNSDDQYEPGALWTVANCFNDIGLNVVCAKSIVVGQGKKFVTSGTDIYFDNLPKTIGFARIDQPETFFRRQLVADVGGLDDRLHYVMDRHLWIKILLRTGISGIRKIDDVLVRFRLHDTSKTVSCGHGFVQEDMQLFAGLLHCLGYHDHGIAFIDDPNLPFLDGLFPDLSGRPDAPQIAAYVLLNAFLSAYAMNNVTRSRWLRSVVDPELLALADRQVFFMICRRIDIVPFSIKKIWNVWRGR